MGLVQGRKSRERENYVGLSVVLPSLPGEPSARVEYIKSSPPCSWKPPIMYQTTANPSGDATILVFAPRRRHELPRTHHTPHVYRNPCTGTWICDSEGTRAKPGPERARTVCRTQLDAVRVALGEDNARPERRLSA